MSYVVCSPIWSMLCHSTYGSVAWRVCHSMLQWNICIYLGNYPVHQRKREGRDQIEAKQGGSKGVMPAQKVSRIDKGRAIGNFSGQSKSLTSINLLQTTWRQSSSGISLITISSSSILIMHHNTEHHTYFIREQSWNLDNANSGNSVLQKNFTS